MLSPFALTESVGQAATTGAAITDVPVGTDPDMPFSVSALFALCESTAADGGRPERDNEDGDRQSLGDSSTPANCLEKALQAALTQAQISGKVFSPQNWLKTKSAIDGQVLVAGTIAGMLPNLGNGPALLKAMEAPAASLTAR